MSKRGVMLKDWRRITVNGVTIVTREWPGEVVVRLAEEAHKKPGKYYLSGDSIYYSPGATTVGHFKIEGPFKDEACTKKIKLK